VGTGCWHGSRWLRGVGRGEGVPRTLGEGKKLQKGREKRRTVDDSSFHLPVRLSGTFRQIDGKKYALNTAAYTIGKPGERKKGVTMYSPRGEAITHKVSGACQRRLDNTGCRRQLREKGNKIAEEEGKGRAQCPDGLRGRERQVTKIQDEPQTKARLLGRKLEIRF